VIEACHVFKAYRLCDRPNDRLSGPALAALARLFPSDSAPGRGLSRRAARRMRHFDALTDVSFIVRRGESVGVIGRNGCGKTTLLQILAGTLAPSSGSVRVRGRVAALLELGSGFNPDFTGRENVFLNGAILGLTPREMEALFDRIAAFADIGDFLDQPVKVYSSGMAVRLAFAVQAFVPKEVLIVDEALSVGDEAFQRKCMARLDEFREGGGTVLFVSHNTQQIVRVCARCLLLHGGRLVADGESKAVTDLYQRLLYSPPAEVPALLVALEAAGPQAATALRAAAPAAPRPADAAVHQAPAPPPGNPGAIDELPDWFDPALPRPQETVYGTGDAEITEFGMFNARGQRVNVLRTGRRYRWTYKARFLREARNVDFGMMLKTADGLDLVGVVSYHHGFTCPCVAAGTEVEAAFDLTLNVGPGSYFLNCGIGGEAEGRHTYLARRVDVSMVKVLPSDAQDGYGLVYAKPGFSLRELTARRPAAAGE
jgi:lipopolysaccharide transport system ATP-binding protein